MSADEIRALADLRKRVLPKHWQAVALWPEHWEQVRDALIDYAAMVERCENLLKEYDLYGSVSDANKQKCDLLGKHVNYILKGATDERK